MTSTHGTSAFICLLVLSVFIGAHATIIEISPSQSISEIARNCAAGDTIVLNDGVYVESVRLTDHSCTVASRFLLDGDSAHIQATRILPDLNQPDSASCFAIHLPESDSVTLIGLSLRGGQGTLWHSPDAPVLAGGAVFSHTSVVHISYCCIDSCVANAGGGIAVIHECPQSSIRYLTVTNSEVAECSSSGLPGGGGIYVWRAPFSVANCVVRQCESISCGGILSIAAPALIIDNRIEFCVGELGGAYISGEPSEVQGNAFLANGCQEFSGTTDLYTYGEVYVRNNIFGENATDNRAIVLDRFQRFGVPFFSGNVIQDRTMILISGALYLTDCEGDFSHNLIANCYVAGGSLISPRGAGVVRMHHNAFVGNSQNEGGSGSVISYSYARSSVYADSNMFDGNLGPAVHFDPDLPHPDHINVRNNWWGHETGPYHPTRNPTGQGDTLLADEVEFEPWLTAPPDTSQSSSVSPDLLHVSTWEMLPAFPNPFNSVLQIDIAGFSRADFALKLYDILGRNVADVHSGPLGSGTLVFSAPPSLASGVYILVASDRAKQRSQKVLFLK